MQREDLKRAHVEFSKEKMFSFSKKKTISEMKTKLHWINNTNKIIREREDEKK